MVAPAAKPAVKTWWENLQAIGFTTGLVEPAASDATVNIDTHGDGTTTVLAGTHNALDAIDGNRKPDIPCERYQIGLHFASPTAVGQITSWKPLGNAPWDQGSPLYVRKTAHVVVAGLASDSGVVDETAPIAEAAASYDVGLLNHVNSNDLRQQGFVLFVSHNAVIRNRWFTAGPQPKGWPPQFLGGLTEPLPGPGTNGASTSTVPNVSDGTTGGARVVVTPFEDNGGTAHRETVQLVRQFILDILAAHDEELVNGIPLQPTPDWAVQGFAVAVQGLYIGNTNPAPGSYNFAALTSALRGLPRAYRAGKIPTGQQLFSGPVPAEQNWNDVAASVYEYIGRKYGVNQMIASAMLLYTRYPTPWGNVLAFTRHGNFNFYTAATMKKGWRAWLARL
jgi:hypothetical protein